VGEIWSVSHLHIQADVQTLYCRSKTVVARKGSEESVQALCQEVMDFSRGEMTDRANGILEFGVNHDMEDKNVFHFFERYSSNAKLGEHNVKPEVKAFMEKVLTNEEGPVSNDAADSLTLLTSACIASSAQTASACYNWLPLQVLT
jgi:quinol monooxygenase YgiN